MLRNVASQKYRVYAWDATTGLAKTGDAANISAHIRKDDAASGATNDTNPTEASSTNEPGYYDFDLTQAETDAAKVSLAPKSGTANIQVVACPPVVYTRPQYSSLLGIASDGDLIKVNTLDGHTAQTGDGFAIVNSGTHGNAALKTLIDTLDNFVDTEVNEILTRIGVPSVSLTSVISALQTDVDDVQSRLPASLSAGGWIKSDLQSSLGVAVTNYDGIAQAGGANTITLAAGSSSVNDFYKGMIVKLSGGTGAKQAGIIIAYNGTTKVATIHRNWITNPDSTTEYILIPGEMDARLFGGVIYATALAAEIDAVWDEAIAGHLAGGSVGSALNAAGSAGDPWTTTLPGAYTGSQAGKILADILVDTGTTLQGELDDIETDVNTLLTRIGVPSVSLAADIAALNDISASDVWASGTRTLTALDEDTTTLDLDSTIRSTLGLSSANLDTQLAKLDTIDDLIDTEIGTILTRIGIPGTSLTASIAALNNLSASQVNAEMVDVLNVDTYTEPTGVPTGTASLVSKIGRLYKVLMRGIEQTATEKRFLDAAGAIEWKKTASDDNTTYAETTALAP